MPTKKIVILGCMMALFAAACQTQTPTGTDPNKETLSRSNPKRSPSPKASGSTGTDGGDGTTPGGGSSSSPGTGSSSSPGTGSSASPSPSASASTSPTTADYWVQVNGADGKGVAGIVVAGYPADTAGVATETGTATTNDKGQIQKIEAAGKALNLVATSPTDDTMRGYLAGVEATASGKAISLAKAGGIKGSVSVTGATGLNLEGIKVYIPGTPFQATTDATGAFTMAKVPVGTYSLTAESAQLGKANKAGVAVATGADTTLTATDLALTVSAPELISMSTNNAGTGVEVTLTGKNFGTGTKEFKVTFAGAEATAAERTSDTTIKATIPDNGDSGDLIVTVGGVASNAKPFKVLSNMIYAAQRTTMPLGATYTFKAAAVDKKGALVDAPHISKWEVSSGDAITVDQTGKVTAAKVGTATLRVSSGAAFETTDVTVTNETVTVTTLAGSTQGTADGTGTAAKFAGPIGITTDGAGNFFVADQFQADDNSIIFSAVRKVTSAGVVTKAYGAGGLGNNDGNATTAKFRFPSGMVFDSQGNLFVCDQGNNLIRKIDPAGNVTTFVGDGTNTSADGSGTSAKTASPAFICRDSSDNLYVTEWGPTTDDNPTGSAGRIRKITPQGVVTTLAGGLNGFFDGTGTGGRFNLPSGIAVDAAGQNLYVADFGNNAIRKIEIATKTVSTLAGPPAPNEENLSGATGLVDGPAVQARFQNPAGLALKSGILYIADDSNHAIRRVDITSGATTTLVGNGTEGSVDGNAVTATFKNPHDLVFGADGALYVLDNRNFRVRKIVF